MNNDSPYELLSPTGWAAPPKLFSFSSLQTVTSCPRRWQLLHSEWGIFSRFPERAHPTAIDGQIVHLALDRLSRALGRRGRPAIGSLEFQAAASECGFWSLFDEQVTEWNSRAARHPRTGPGFLIRTAPRELANRAVRLLREQYRPGATKALDVHSAGVGTGSIADRFHREGALSEVRLNHPTLLLTGTLDLVFRDADGETVVVDFKTGTAKDTHRDQLLLYAMLWWRCSSRAPAKIAVQYLASGWEEPISDLDMTRVEERVALEINAALAALAQQPAPARPSQDCARCPVRARCDAGWPRVEPGPDLPGRTVDVELTVIATPTPTGFTGHRLDGRELPVVYDSAVGRTLPELTSGSRLRLIDAVPVEDGKAVEVRPWSEVFLL